MTKDAATPPSDAERGTETLRLWIGRARALAALAGFALAVWICRREGFAWTDSALRGLAAAAALSLVAWWSALMVVTALMRSAAHRRDEEARAAALAAAEVAGAGEGAPARRRAPGGGGEGD